MNVANALTTLRIILTPVCCYLIWQQSYLHAVVTFFIAGLTDWLDGFWARKLGASSAFGKIYDPLADKVLVVSTYYVLGWVGVFHPVLVWLTILRDVFLVCGASYIIFRQLSYDLSPVMMSKINTFCQLFLVAFALVHLLDPTFISAHHLFFGQILVGATTILSMGAYIIRWLKYR